MIFTWWDKVRSRGNLLVTIGIANIAALITGMMTTWPSPVLHVLQSNEDNPLGSPITSAEASWVASLHLFGGIFGPYPYGYLQNKIGRKYTILLTVIPYILSYAMAAFSEQVELFYIVRFFAGIGIGGVFAVIPTYIAEVSDVTTRGMLSSTFPVFICFGMLLSFVFGPYLSVRNFNMLELIFPIIMIAFFYFLPETPYCLMEKGRSDEAQQTLVYLRGTVDVQAELKQIEVEVHEYTKNKGTFCDIFKTKRSTKAFVIAVTLTSICQVCGIDVVLTYTQEIFDSAGVSTQPSVAAIVVGAVQFISSLITPAVIDRLGRKALIQISSIFVIISEVFLGMFFYLQEEGHDVADLSWLPITTLIIYILGFSLGLGPVPWTLMSEILPGNIRGVASSISISLSYVSSFLIVFTFNDLTELSGKGGPFWIYASMSVLTIVFVAIWVPETKGKNFQEIQDII